MKPDRVMDVLLVVVGVVLVVLGAAGVHDVLSVVRVHDPAPGWRAYTAWFLGAGLAICALGMWLGSRGIGGFASLAATGGSLLGTLLAVIMVGQLAVREFRLGRGMTCQVVVQSVEYAPREYVRSRPYLVTAKVQKVLSGDVDPKGMVFRVPDRDQITPGTGLELRYRKAHRWTDMKTWFQRHMRDALEEAVAMSVQSAAP